MKLFNNCVDMFKTNCFYTEGYQFLSNHYKEFVLRENQITRFSAKINSKHILFSLKFQYNFSIFMSVKHHKIFVNSSFYKNHKFIRQMKSFLMLKNLISDFELPQWNDKNGKYLSEHIILVPSYRITAVHDTIQILWHFYHTIHVNYFTYF